MLGLLLELGVGALLTWGDERRKAKRQARDFAAGAEVRFVACLLGDRPYCRSASLVFLWASRSTLHFTPTEFGELHRSPIPVDRLEVLRVRPRARTDSRLVQWGWEVAECRDGDSVVLIGCAPASMRHLTAVLKDQDPKGPHAEQTGVA
ncbi:hypothetical protein [Streptomyces sp. NPDC059874]|uniref:hypothetical protein n=1 Tax=Streptomyces sp. NPDC059874 TaxID=3346983 RepID=UPI00365A69C8